MKGIASSVALPSFCKQGKDVEFWPWLTWKIVSYPPKDWVFTWVFSGLPFGLVAVSSQGCCESFGTEKPSKRGWALFIPGILRKFSGPHLVAHPTNRKWVITPVINGISRVNPLITGVITHLLSGMSHQAGWKWTKYCLHRSPVDSPSKQSIFWI